MKATTIRANIKRCECRAQRLDQKCENYVKFNIPAIKKTAADHRKRAAKLREQLELLEPKGKAA